MPSSQTAVTREAPPALQDKVRPSLLSRTVSSVKRAFTRKKITTDTLASPPSLAEVANAYKTPVEQKSIGIERTPETEAVRKVIQYEDVGTSPYKPTHNYRDLTQAELKKLYMYIHTNNPGIIEAPPTGRQPSFYTDKNLRKVIKASKFIENTTGQALDEILNELIGGGKYTNDGDGLYSNEIQQILKDRTHRVIPVIASDEIPSLYSLVDGATKDFAFIMNLDPSTKQGSHWVAVYISRPDASIEYYDSLVHAPSKRFLKDIKPLIERMKDTVYYKLKVNLVKDQSDSSSNCGYFAIAFLDKRLHGSKFKEASFYDKSMEGERNIEQYKTYL